MSAAGELILLNAGRLTTCEFSPVPLQTARMGAAGASAVTVLGPTLWHLNVVTAFLTMSQARLWTAWINRRQGRAYTFTAPRLMRVVPNGHIATADGSLTLTVDIPNSRLTIGGVGTGATLKIGDMVSYRTAANGYYAGEVQADATASGGNLVIDVLPTPVAKHTTTPAVRRVQALAEFELATDPGAIDVYDDRTITFEAMQVLR